jgi:hypothetical protein
MLNPTVGCGLTLGFVNNLVTPAGCASLVALFGCGTDGPGSCCAPPPSGFGFCAPAKVPSSVNIPDKVKANFNRSSVFFWFSTTAKFPPKVEENIIVTLIDL